MREDMKMERHGLSNTKLAEPIGNPMIEEYAKGSPNGKMIFPSLSL
jgi:hypothetical protein